MSDLKNYWDVELGALCVIGEPLCRIDIESKPERMDVRTFESQLFDRALQSPHALHALEGIDAGKSNDAVRKFSHQLADLIVGEVGAHLVFAVEGLLERRYADFLDA